MVAYLKLILPLGLLCVLASCANIVRPEGGAIDEKPPAIVQEKSSPNFQVQFKKQPIELTFDEWIELNDVFNQVVISPPLEYKYELTIRKRTVTLAFDEREELRADATYTINFGESVRDITERNPAENLRYVFSTGDFIDSLSVRGIIVDAFTNEPVEGALFMLYENLADSVVRTERPFYFARTAANGQFVIENVKAGVFKGFALQDQNLNYRFDQVLEPIGFPDDVIVVSDSTEPSLVIKLFTEEQPIRLSGSDDDTYGQVGMTFTKALEEDFGISWQKRGRTTVLEVRTDTTKLWYAQENEEGWKIYIQQDTMYYDTINVRVSDRDAFMQSAKLQALSSSVGKLAINPNQPLGVAFNHPISRIDTAAISIFEDTLRKLITPTLRLDTNGQRKLLFSYPWRESYIYALEFMPGALTDIYGFRNDTIIQEYQVQAQKSFGNLMLIIDSLSTDSTYLLELFENKSDIPQDTFQIKGISRFKKEMKGLKPGQYTIRMTIDWNGNGRWDTGNYDDHRQPEPVLERKLEQLRANWDLETLVTLKDMQVAARISPPRVPSRRKPLQQSSSQLDSLENRDSLLIPESPRDTIAPTEEQGGN
jgi:hypothetical protein